MTKVIGITGGIGSGKSTVTRLLAELGAVVIDADKVGHEAFKPGTPAYKDVVAAFGERVLNGNGDIDRKKLGEVVFRDSEALIRLNRIMHPRMHEMIKAQIEEYRRQGADVVALEAAVLIEASEPSWIPLVDEVWVVVAGEKAVVERLEQQRGLAKEQTLSRVHSQLPASERVKYATVVIDNDSDVAALKAKVGQLWDRLHGGQA